MKPMATNLEQSEENINSISELLPGERNRESRPVHSGSKHNFILLQGLNEPSQQTCPLQYSALMFQPRLVGLLSLLGVILQSAVFFLVLSVILLWSALMPRWNPFDALYNHTLGTRPGTVKLDAAPGPRRFAQGMAGTTMLIIVVALLLDRTFIAYAFESFLLIAIAALVFGRLCLGSLIFYLLRGRKAFVMRTLRWSGLKTEEML
jgi:hypothetical protein